VSFYKLTLIAFLNKRKYSIGTADVKYIACPEGLPYEKEQFSASMSEVFQKGLGS
jgi:hypothetical protein